MRVHFCATDSEIEYLLLPDNCILYSPSKGFFQISSLSTVSVCSLLRKTRISPRSLYSLTPCNWRSCRPVIISNFRSVISRYLFDFTRIVCSFEFWGQKLCSPFKKMVFCICKVLIAEHDLSTRPRSLTFTALLRLVMLRTCSKNRCVCIDLLPTKNMPAKDSQTKCSRSLA